MNNWLKPFVLAAMAIALVATPAVRAAETTLTGAQPVADFTGAKDFDFEFGDWRVHHRIYRPFRNGQWSEFEGTVSVRPLMGSLGNVEEHRFERPTGPTYGIAIRSYNPKTAEWAIWWIDSRVPHGAMDPPMKGRFDNGVGTFYSDSTLDGKPIKVRFIWTAGPSGRSPHWEQAYSDDGGKTWIVNWIMDFERAA